MRIALLSPFHGGSHQAWAEGLRAASKHAVDLFTLPARFWKWRMHGGGVKLAAQLGRSPSPYDLLVASSMCDLSTVLALTRQVTSRVPTVYYLHENQLTYPLPEDPREGPMRRQRGERDLHYAFINYVSALAATRVVFNSEYHKRTWLASLPAFLHRFPDEKDIPGADAIAQRSAVLPPGVDLEQIRGARRFVPKASLTGRPPLVLWNQRWEYDRAPAVALRVLEALAALHMPFEVAVVGENRRQSATEFGIARERLGARVRHWGWANPAEYEALLAAADITFSTTVHEFFGIAVVEAVGAAAYPLLPRRLAYPEVIPLAYHERCLYETEDELVDRLATLLASPQGIREVAESLATEMDVFDWRKVGPRYDSYFERLVNQGGDRWP